MIKEKCLYYRWKKIKPFIAKKIDERCDSGYTAHIQIDFNDDKDYVLFINKKSSLLRYKNDTIVVINHPRKYSDVYDLDFNDFIHSKWANEVLYILESEYIEKEIWKNKNLKKYRNDTYWENSFKNWRNEWTNAKKLE